MVHAWRTPGAEPTEGKHDDRGWTFLVGCREKRRPIGSDRRAYCGLPSSRHCHGHRWTRRIDFWARRGARVRRPVAVVLVGLSTHAGCARAPTRRIPSHLRRAPTATPVRPAVPFRSRGRSRPEDLAYLLLFTVLSTSPSDGELTDFAKAWGGAYLRDLFHDRRGRSPSGCGDLRVRSSKVALSMPPSTKASISRVRRDVTLASCAWNGL